MCSGCSGFVGCTNCYLNLFLSHSCCLSHASCATKKALLLFLLCVFLSCFLKTCGPFTCLLTWSFPCFASDKFNGTFITLTSLLWNANDSEPFAENRAVIFHQASGIKFCFLFTVVWFSILTSSCLPSDASSCLSTCVHRSVIHRWRKKKLKKKCENFNQQSNPDLFFCTALWR